MRAWKNWFEEPREPRPPIESHGAGLACGALVLIMALILGGAALCSILGLQ